MPLYGLGLALSGLVLRFRDSDSLMGLITSAASLLSGATYPPIQALPLWLGFLVRVLPMHALDDALYYELIGYLNATHVAYLVLASAVYLSLGAYLYGRLQKSLLRKGIV